MVNYGTIPGSLLALSNVTITSAINALCGPSLKAKCIHGHLWDSGTGGQNWLYPRVLYMATGKIKSALHGNW
jgi:hypothetical protein